MDTQRFHGLRLAAMCLAGALLSCAAGIASAEVLVVNDQLQIRDSALERPQRGATKDQVEARYGAPTTRHPAVGAPPITRWDYPSFSVFFEHDRVIHTVVTSS